MGLLELWDKMQYKVVHTYNAKRVYAIPTPVFLLENGFGMRKVRIIDGVYEQLTPESKAVLWKWDNGEEYKDNGKFI